MVAWSGFIQRHKHELEFKEFCHIVPVVQSIVLSNHGDSRLPTHSLFQAPKCLEIQEKTDAKHGLLQWYGHPRILSISISKTRATRASPSHITLAMGVRVVGKGFGNGDAHITVTAPSKRSRSAVRRNSDPVPHTTVKWGSQWGGGFYGYRLKFWLFYGYRLIFFSYG